MKKEYPETVLRAAYEYVRRQGRSAHPDGQFDSGGRWYPSECEERPCCSGIRRPSRAWPYTLMSHCRSMAHVAALYDVDARDVHRAVRAEAWRVLQAQEVLAK
jgi:hypothetical protein